MECWIPEEIELQKGEDWADYENRLYDVFSSDFIESTPKYQDLPIVIRTDPRYDGKEEAFWHLTCRDYQHVDGKPESRDPDIERCRRIRWPRAVIEEHMACSGHVENEWGCRGVMVWRSTHPGRRSRSQERIKFFLEDEQYLVVLEPRKSYYLLITAYYVDQDWSLKSIRKEAERCGAIVTGLENAGSAD